jgi:excisionase family DNA binding protein
MTKLTEYLQTAEAAEYLGVAQNTIRKWAARGELPVHRNPENGYRLFKQEDLKKFLAKVAKKTRGLSPSFFIFFTSENLERLQVNLTGLPHSLVPIEGRVIKKFI